MQRIKEGLAEVYVPKEKKVSKKLPVFYNPAMKLNRDISVIVLNSLGRKKLNIALPLAGTGVRGVRFARELKKGVIGNLWINDYSEKACRIIKKNLQLNKIKSKNIHVTQKDANLFLLESSGFDYIDLDPFGTPNPFLESAVKRVARGGILAVTATDTSALAGTYPDACKRKYWAVPLDNELMHEAGLRILIRKVQLIGAQYAKALTPIYSYSFEHYMRVFFSCEKGKKKVDDIISKHGMIQEAGPMWLGSLWDRKLAAEVARQSDDEMASVISRESKINTIGLYDIHKICKKNRISRIPKIEDIMKKIRKSGSRVSRTHFLLTGIRSNIEEKKLARIIRLLS